MIASPERKVIVLYEDSYLADLLERMDRLHTAVVEGRLHTLTTIAHQDVVGWLEDIVYTAEETIREIQPPDEQTEVARRFMETRQVSSAGNRTE